MTATQLVQLKSGEMLYIELSERLMNSLDAVLQKPKHKGSWPTLCLYGVLSQDDSSGNLVRLQLIGSA